MKLERFKAIFITIMSAAFAYLGVLAVPVFAFVALNFTDYITGIVSSGTCDKLQGDSRHL